MSLCARCGMNEPLPTDPDDFCADCVAEISVVIDELEERRRKAEYQRLEFDGGAIVNPRWVIGPPPENYLRDTMRLIKCKPCECGGSPDCPRCNP